MQEMIQKMMSFIERYFTIPKFSVTDAILLIPPMKMKAATTVTTRPIIHGWIAGKALLQASAIEFD